MADERTRELTPEGAEVQKRLHELYEFLTANGCRHLGKDGRFDEIMNRLLFTVASNCILAERRRVFSVIKNAGDAPLSEDERFYRIICRVTFPYEKGVISDGEKEYIRDLHHNGGQGIRALERITQRDDETIMRICNAEGKKAEEQPGEGRTGAGV